MRTMSKVSLTVALAVLFAASPLADAAQKYPDGDLQKRLEERYPSTVFNAEGGIAVQGATLTLKVTGLTGGVQNACVNEYADGKIRLASASKAVCAGGTVSKVTSVACHFGYCPPPASQSALPDTRSFVQTEKWYVRKIEVTDATALTLVSDSINNVTYKAVLRFPTPKGSSLDFTQADQLISEVFTSSGAPAPTSAVRPASTSGAQPASTGTAPKPRVFDLPQAPPSDPEPIRLGMSIDQVVAILGQPAKLVDLGTKQIYSYPKLKVTFVNGKVSDVD